MIPNPLYRGDSDPQNVRLLKSTLHHGKLYSNLLSGGIGNIIFTEPLIELIKKHINPGWEKSHFLSFTSSKEKALFYGRYGLTGETTPTYDYHSKWDFVRIIFDTNYFDELKELELGVYRCSYKSNSVKCNGNCVLLLIDTVVYIESQFRSNVNQYLDYAKRDEEWLVLPMNKIVLNNNQIEYSAEIDMGALIDYELFYLHK